MDTKFALLKQEKYNSNIVNPTVVKLDEINLLNKIQDHLVLKRKITFIAPESNNLMLEITGWNFNEITYRNDKPVRILGYINLNAIENFYKIKH